MDAIIQKIMQEVGISAEQADKTLHVIKQHIQEKVAGSEKHFDALIQGEKLELNFEDYKQQFEQKAEEWLQTAKEKWAPFKEDVGKKAEEAGEKAEEMLGELKTKITDFFKK